MCIEELQSDLPDMLQDIRNLLRDLECAESCDSKADFCENIRSAINKASIVKQELVKILKSAEKSKA